MHVKVYDRAKLPIITTIDLTPINYDAYATWGPWTATIEAKGAMEAMEALRHWIGFYVVIHNDNGRPVWWGKVTGVDAPYGDLSIGVDFTDMYNRVRVLYSYTVGDETANAITAWSQHNASVDAFGRKEIRHSIGEANANMAAAAALTILDAAALVPMNIGLTESPTALLRCQGLGKMLDWVYYENQAGYVAYMGVETVEQPIGWGTTASDIGFTDRMIQKLGGNLGSLIADEPIRISGSTSNNGTKTANGASTERDTYTANTISFAAADDILDSAEGLNFAKVGSFVQISGSTLNNGIHLLDEVARGQIATSTTITGTIDAEAAGPAITIVQASTLGTTEDVVTEAPGASVTLTGPQRVRYSFTTPVVGSWAAHEVWIRARAIGTPSDSLRVSIYSDSAGSLGTQLDTATITGISKKMGWVSLALTGAATLAYGSTYWIVVERTGTNSTANYYTIGADGDQGGTGLYYVWNGTAWATRPYSLPFQVWGHVATTTQLQTILTDAGQFLSGVDIRINSGVLRRQYRAGDMDALAQCNELLEAGTATGGILLARINEDWRAVVEVAPDASPTCRLLRSGKLSTVRGTPLEDGVLPVGEWMSIDGLSGQEDGLIANAPFLVGYMEYSARRGISDIRAYGSNSVWDMDSILQG